MNETVLTSSPVMSIYYFIAVALGVGFLFFGVVAAVVMKLSTQKDIATTATNLLLLLFLITSISLGTALSYHQFTYSSEASESLSIFDYQQSEYADGRYEISFITEQPTEPVLLMRDTQTEREWELIQLEQSDEYNHYYLFYVDPGVVPEFVLQIDDTEFYFSDEDTISE